jgi:CubicO group peptidase (beta-lactamase class C family)
MATAGAAATALTGVANADSDARTVAIRSSGGSGHAYGPALDELVTYAGRELAAAGLPGMTVCVVDAEGFAAMRTFGWADIGRRIPVSPSHLFEIGSISKSFGALCVHRLADEGKIDLSAPLSRYLPDAPLPAEPILVQQILSHVAGLPRSAPVFPRVPDQRLWTGFTPGTKFSYSNLGYELLGMLVAKISGKPYPLAVRELVIEPLGITGHREVLQPGDRARYAVGYSPLDASGPNMFHVPLGQTQWVNIDTADGDIGATADAMSRYLHYLIAVGRGRGAPLFSDVAAKRFSTVLEPAAAEAGVFGKGTAYASGLGIIDLDGHTTFFHTGGAWGFVSSITVDPVTGVGCFVGVNAQIAGYRPTHISNYACRLLRHVREGGRTPSPAEGSWLEHIERAEDYVGTYVAPDGDRFHVVARSGRLFLAADGGEGRLEFMGEQKFLSDHPRFGSYFFNFERSGNGVAAVWFGAVLYGRGAALAQPAVPPGLAALQGTYFSSDPFTGWWRSVVAQGERLVIENVAFYRVQNTLHRKGDYWHVDGNENQCERIRFEAVMNGVPQRLNFSGRDMWRFDKI